MSKGHKAERSWLNISFLLGTPVLSVLLAVYYFETEVFNPYFILLFFAFYILTGFSMTAGYHRLFSHRTYKTEPWLEWFYLLFGAAAFQNSALLWADDHRHHHRFVDTEGDPYSAQKGLFHSHIGWVFYKDVKARDFSQVKDLYQNPRIRFQHENFFKTASIVGILLPTFIGWMMGSAIGGFLFGGIGRVVVVHHFIFLINSLAHYWGKQTYSDKSSAKDNPWLAFFTYGEGYHNFHHAFESDYRNGVKWYHFDPTKWLIRTLASVGAAKDLRRVNEAVILRARLMMDRDCLMKSLPYTFESFRDSLESLQSKILEAKTRMRRLKDEYYRGHASRMQSIEHIKAEIQRAKADFKQAYREWQMTIALARKYA